MSQSGKGRIVSSSNVSGFACSCGESFRRSAELERHQNNCPFSLSSNDGPETRQSNTRGADRRRRHVQQRHVNAMGGGSAGGGGAGGGADYAPGSAADVFHTAGSTGSAGGSAGGGGGTGGGAGDAPGSAADVFHAARSTGSISPEGPAPHDDTGPFTNDVDHSEDASETSVPGAGDDVSSSFLPEQQLPLLQGRHDVFDSGNNITSGSESSCEGTWANGDFFYEEGDGDMEDEAGDQDGIGDGIGEPLPLDELEYGQGGDGAGEGDIPSIDKIHHDLGGTTMEGGFERIRFNTKARGSRYYPFRSGAHLGLWIFVHQCQISREAVDVLLTILTMKYGGQAFNVQDLEGFTAEHFYARTRECLPLLEIKERDVESTQEGATHAKVYDTPLNLLIDRECRLICSTDVSRTHPGGKIVSPQEVSDNQLASAHVNCIPVKKKNDVMSTNMHGKLARGTPFSGIDGILAQCNNRKVYINDICMCNIEGDDVLCRVLEMYWDENQSRVLVSARRFRTVGEVRDTDPSGNITDIIRVWEDASVDVGVTLAVTDVLDLAEIYTREEVVQGLHNADRWSEGPRNRTWGPFMGEGFVQASSRRKRRNAGADPSCNFQVSQTPWSREGTKEFPLFSVRNAGFHLNRKKLPFFSAPIVFYNDAFNVTGMSVQKSVGGGYFGWLWRDPAVQRKRRETHVGIIAAPGACYEGEIGFQCDIISKLQKGCLAHVRLPRTDGGNHLVKMLVADSPRRALLLCTKHPNSASKHPCPYCMVTQTDDESSSLGDPQYDIDAHRRTLGEMKDGWKELERTEGKAASQKLSTELGLVADSAGRGRPLYDKLAINPILHVPVERLHADALGTTANCQKFMIELLSSAGRKLVIAIMGQKHTLFPYGTEPLKCIVTAYTSLTGSDKWVLASIMLLVFKPLLQDVDTMMKYFRVREINRLTGLLGSAQTVLEHLRSLVQVTSKLAFAVRASSFSPDELNHLDLLSRDVVGHFSATMGTVGVKPTTHSTLHYRDAVKQHGVLPDASTGEFAHQQNKQANRSSSGRDPAAHYARRANTNAAVLALAMGLEYDVTKFDRSRKGHVKVRVRPGPDCVTALQELGTFLRLGFSGPRDIHAAPTPTPNQLKGQYPGGAVWSTVLWKDGDVVDNEHGWEARVGTGHLRPCENTLRLAYKKHYGCSGGGGVSCHDSRCPGCSCNPQSLDNLDISCSRFYHAAPYSASNGKGRWKGGDVKAARGDAPRDEWALGAHGGTDLEIWKTIPSTKDGPVDTNLLTIGKALYFFEHEANAPAGGGPGPKTWWVLVFDYVGIGPGNTRVPDSITQHPILRLRGRGRPLVYPVDAIRRQVHLYHQCPTGESAEWTCGEAPATPTSGVNLVWRHKYKLASPDNDLYDNYLLNEFHHGTSRDSFVD